MGDVVFPLGKIQTATVGSVSSQWERGTVLITNQPESNLPSVRSYNTWGGPRK